MSATLEKRRGLEIPAVDWLPDWSAWPVVIVASGSSAAAADLDQLRGRARVIVVNNSWRLATWADLLYACDGKWWIENQGCQAFKGIKVSQDKAVDFADVRLVAVANHLHQIVLAPRGLLGSGRNSGFQALNLAVQTGTRRIALVGYDMTGEHWHGRHAAPLGNPSDNLKESWREIFDRVAPDLAAAGVAVVNCSPVSAITGIARQSFGDFIASL